MATVDDTAPRELTCSPSSPSALRCSWKHGNSPQLTSYYVQYTIVSGYDYHTDYRKINTAYLPKTQQTLELSDLHPYTGYLVKLQATGVTDSDTSTAAITMPQSLFQLLFQIFSLCFPCSIAPSAAINDLEIVANSPTSLQLSWLPPKRGDWRGRIENYLITATRQDSTGRRKRQDSSSKITFEVKPQTNHPDPSLATEPLQPETFELKDLQPFSQYAISVAAVTSAGAGVSTPPVIMDTPVSGSSALYTMDLYAYLNHYFYTAPTGSPINIVVTSRSYDSFTVNWSPPVPATGEITAYVVNFTTSDGSIQETLPGSITSFTRRGLKRLE